MACLNLLWIIVSNFFIFLFYSDKSLLSATYYATSSNLWVLAKFAVKLAPVIYIVADPKLSYAVLYSIGFAGINFANFAAFKVMWPYSRGSELI